MEDNFQEDAALDAVGMLLRHMSLLGLSLVLEDVTEAIAKAIADADRKADQLAKNFN